jgi:hypothetical protein
MEISDDPFTCAEQLVFISKSEARLAFDTSMFTVGHMVAALLENVS